MNCVYCESERVLKNGKDRASGQVIQTYRCKDCGRRFKERSGTPMARLRTSPEAISIISPQSEVHANHNEAHNSALRRRASAYHRRQNHYAKVVEELQRALSVQRLIHNWVRPH
jgi:transposase-like protein